MIHLLISLMAQSGLDGGARSAASPNQRDATIFQVNGGGGIFGTISNTLLFLLGAVAVIMMIIGGLKYVVSGGNQQSIDNAKNTILYAIVGIVVAFLSYPAVQFVVGQLQGA